MTTLADNEIRTRSCPECYLCGAKGELLYQGLRDRLFGAPGTWDLKRCPDPECGLVWLDPMPIEEDIGKAYQTYCTHRKDGNSRHYTGLRRFVRSTLRITYDLVLLATPIGWVRKRLNFMYLANTRPGRLLEVGCGNGQRLMQFRALGWQVEGQEVDPNAAAFTHTSCGINVHLGKLDTLGLSPATFDAIIMNHVIEHVHDPVALFAECHRLLKPGGKLVAATPNIASYGHKRFGSFWMALDPPRHLHLFSCQALQQVAETAGFTHYELWTTNANGHLIAAASLDIQHYGRHIMGTDSTKLSTHLTGAFFNLWAYIICLGLTHSGEACILKAMK